MEVQNVFDKVIEAGLYGETTDVLMCKALRFAKAASIVSEQEFNLANVEIRKYLGGFGSLGGLLSNKEQDWSFAGRLAIYKDWANKPKFKAGD